MKQIPRKLWLTLITVIMMLSLATSVFAAKKTAVTDIDSITELTVDFTQAAQIPMEGWYSKTLESGRTVEMYVPTYASCRAYFTVVAVPNGVKDVQKWADTMGFTKTIADRGEVLVILEPANKKWGKLDKELAYVTEAMSFVSGGKNAAGITLFTNYSTFYLAGYGEGAASLEAWAAANPILVGSQVYVGGQSAGGTYLKETGSVVYDGTNTGGYDPGIADIDEFTKVMAEHGYTNGPITKSEVAVPTWFINYSAFSPSVKYWASANDVTAKFTGNLLDRTYWQDINSDAFQTEYANSCSTTGHGISCIKLSYSMNATAAKIGKFLYGYSRYNVPFAYSNHLSERQDFTAVRVAAQKAAQKADYLTEKQYVAYDAPITSDAGTVYDGYYVLARKQGKMGQGIVESGIFASSDDDGDGVLDAHEYLMYIPNASKGKKVPVVMQFPGNTQSVSVGFDSTQWWRVANETGAIIVIVGETYQNRSSAALTWKNADMSYYPITDIIRKNIDGKKADIDWDRIYGSGHSAGSATVQTFVHTHPEFFAAVASTSFGSRQGTGVGETVPTMLVCGHSDLPRLMNNLWDNQDLQTNWFGYLAKVNDLKVKVPAIDNCDAKVEGTARTYLYTWNNKQDFPMVVWGQTYLREHNCHPTEIPMSWDFIKNYKLLDDGTRLYSPSGFEKDDAAVIETTADDFDAVTELATDYSQAAQLPMTGYYTKSISDGRTVKVYISEEASVRSYFTVVAVPDGVNTYEFLRREGWIALADEKGEGLFVLEPGTDGWGSVEEETAYVNAAIDYLKKTRNTNNISTFSTFGEFYLAGYGKAAAPLEAWAAANPIFVISQAYINGESVDEATLETLGNVLYDGSNTSGYDPGLTEDADFRSTLEETGIEQIARKDVAVPTMFAGNSYAQSSLAYWLAANDCESNAVDGVYYQKKDSKSLVTQYANSQLDAFAAHGISQVKLASADVKAAEIYDFLATYTRYDNTFAYSNGLFLRLDYTSARVAAQKDAKDGEVLSELSNGAAVLAKSDVALEGNGTVEIGIMAFADNNNDGQNDPREYLMYIPDGFEGTKLPVLIVSPGNSQTDSIFMDSTLWWQVANKEGILVIIVTETYSSATGVSHANSDKFYESLICMLKEQTNGNQCDIDFNRIYGTGQSGGSMETQGFVRTHPEFYAAAASTSGLAIPREGAWLPEGVGGSMPCFLIAAQSDLGNLMDDLWTSALATDWIEYLFKVNGMEDSDIGSADMPHTSINNNRTRLYTWANGQNINMIQYGYTLLRAHNCHPSEMPILWDFLEHFSFEKDDEGNFTRFYSESAFSENDAVEIITEK